MSRFREALVELARGAQTVDGSPSQIGWYLPDSIALNVGTALVLGRSSEGDLQHRDHFQLVHSQVQPRHCVVVREPRTGRYWIAGCGPSCPTYVNKRPISVCRLLSGDLVQVGPFAWIFSEAHGYLEAVGAIKGLQLRLRDVGLEDNRLQAVSFEVPSGQMLAIVGPSGSGKSTLARVLIGAPGAYDRGQVLADGRDIGEDEEWFRGQLGYVSQKDVLLRELKTREAVAFAAELRGKPGGPEVEHILRQVDIQDKEPSGRRGIWATSVGKLSGGQAKRVQTAAALVAEPRLLILDEPGSGLDHDREVALLRLLRSLSYRGCTIVVVTHNERLLDSFDRVLKIENGGKIAFDGTPTAFCNTIPREQFRDLPPHEANHGDDDAPTPPAARPPEIPLPVSCPSPFAQWKLLLTREFTLLGNSPSKRLLVPLAIVPVFFAAALGVAVPATDHHLLGFLAVLSCIWMGASLSLMSIVNEREVFDHERLLFLRIAPYVASKATVLLLLSAVQVVVFMVVLLFFREHVRSDAMLYGVPSSMVVLVLVGWAGTGLGLLISASVGSSRPLANFLLPLLMMLQIVFSVQVAGNGTAPLEEAYGEFTWRYCRAHADCRRRAQYWMPPDVGWTCDRCLGRDGTTPLDNSRDELENSKRPNPWATLASYATISRYGDMALRTFAYSTNDFEASRSAEPLPDSSHERFRYKRWWREALGVLTAMVLGFPVLAGVVLDKSRHTSL